MAGKHYMELSEAAQHTDNSDDTNWQMVQTTRPRLGQDTDHFR